MKRSLPCIGVLALVLWTVGGALAWWQAKGHWTLVVQEGAPGPSEADQRFELFDERVRGLSTDVQALARLLEQNLGVLDEHGELRASELRAEVAGGWERVGAELERAGTRTDLLAGRIEALERSLRGELAAALGAPPSGAQDREVPAPVASAPDSLPEPQPVAATPAQPIADPLPTPRASFLAFRLPSDDFNADERRTWTVVPALSRVGFDAQSTLHDFSGTTSDLSGSVTVELAHPERAPQGRVSARARNLATGDDGRDEGLCENLDVEHHPELVFELQRFEPEPLDPATPGAEQAEGAKLRIAGRAHGLMRIRGVEREVVMPVELRLDDAHRLAIEGKLELALPDYGVPVPSKLGLIRMDDTVRVWINLRARLEPRRTE